MTETNSACTDLTLSEDDSSQLRDGTRKYMEDISRELSVLAFKVGWDSLAVIFEMAGREARRIGRHSQKNVEVAAEND